MSSVGQKLKDARISKGLTLDDLQQITKIQKRYLIAIEEGNYKVLPGEFYVNAFVKQYAETVGLDSSKILDDLNNDLGNLRDREDNSDDEATSRMQKRQNENGVQGKSKGINDKIAKYLPITIIIIIVIGILGTIYAVALGNHKKDKNQQIEQTTSHVSVSTDVSKKRSKANYKHSSIKSNDKKQYISFISSSGPDYKYKVYNSPSLNIITVGASNQPSWNAIYANNIRKWEGTIQAGQQMTIKVPSSVTNFTLDIGNSKATVININGHKLDFLNQNSSLTVRKLIFNFVSDNKSTDSNESNISIDMNNGNSNISANSQTAISSSNSIYNGKSSNNSIQ